MNAAPFEAEEHAGQGTPAFLLFTAAPSYLISFVMHLLLIVVMALITISHAKETFPTDLVVQAPDIVQAFEEVAIPLPSLTFEDSSERFDGSLQGQADAMQPQVEGQSVVVSSATEVDPASASPELETFADRTAPKDALLKDRGTLAGSGLGLRDAARRGDFDAGKAGGTPASQQAVALALRWLANHQNADGSFNFNHQSSPQCSGKCGDRGRLEDCTTGATGLALLPFLGAGQTHRQGEYRTTVEKGLYYLVSRMKVQRGMGSLAEGGGNLYSHGIAAIVLCEAYAMTHDKGLQAPAQAALNYTMYAQDPLGGGWRYTARQPGDTSAVGWQLMALKSGHLAYLYVDPATIQGAAHFLDGVQSESGAKYGYTSPGGGSATTAVGLLSRMYLGWKHDHPALQRGVEFLDRSGPSPGNLYYNYYATQVMRHYGGEPWERWNEKMREQLVGSQALRGHETGSWFLNGGDHGSDAGGRLYCTSMATMILEVYYRHLPLYAKAAAETDFPL